MTSKYSYVRFRWWDPVDLDKVVEEFSGFKTKKIIHVKGGQNISLYKDQRDEVEVEADHLAHQGVAQNRFSKGK